MALKNNLQMQVWEHRTPQLRRYSFHVMRGNKLVVRWDNSPHYRKIGTFPHHKHIGTNVLESEEMTIEKVLNELSNRLSVYLGSKYGQNLEG